MTSISDAGRRHALAAPLRQTRIVHDGDAERPSAPRPALSLRGVTKRFGAVSVLHGVDLDVRAGEIVALVGANGAGKSTVVHCVARTYGADDGTIQLNGHPLVGDAIRARDEGVAVVWQDLALCDNLTVVANLFLGNERLGGRLLDEFAMADEAVAL